MQGHWVDFGIILIVGLSILTGIFRGFVKELVALCVWGLAIWLAYSYSDTVAPMLESWIKDASMRTVISFIAILVSTLLVGGICNATLSYALKRTGLSGTDRTLGMVFGFVRGVCLVGLLIIGVQMTSLPIEKYEKESVLYARFEPLVAWMQGYMPDFINKVKEADVHNHLADAQNTLTVVDN